MHHHNSIINIIRLRYFMFDPETLIRQRRLWPGQRRVLFLQFFFYKKKYTLNK